MKVVIQPVNPGFKDYVLRYVSEIEEPHYEFVGVEGFGRYVFECSSDNPWTAVDGIKPAIRRPPIGNAMSLPSSTLWHGMLATHRGQG